MKTGQELFNWIHEEKPEEMCILAGFCSETQPLQKLPPSLKPIVVHWLELQTPSQELHDEDQCNTCQLVILEAASVLSQPVLYPHPSLPTICSLTMLSVVPFSIYVPLLQHQ